jgi:MFS family permease
MYIYIMLTKYISKQVWIISLVSFFTDIASEMLYPIVPFYLQNIGFSILLIGILEGVAEFLAGSSKAYFGNLSDSKNSRKPFIQLGYLLSAISKPMMAAFIYPLWIFFARSIDRLGKGIRTGARDALLNNETTQHNRGKIFGFHRSLDTFGAVLGPILALILLQYYSLTYKQIFLVALVPGLLAILCTFFIKEKVGEKPLVAKTTFIKSFQYFKSSNSTFKKIVLGLFVFALFNSSDVFLLLKAKESGLSDIDVIKLYIFYNLIYAIMAFPMGLISDKVGAKKVMVSGFVIFATVYAGFSFADDVSEYIILFLLYGLYAAATEGVAKAYLSNFILKKEAGASFGTYSAFQSIAALFASIIASLIWYNLGAKFTFIFTSIVALFVCVYFLFLNDRAQVSEK